MLNVEHAQTIKQIVAEHEASLPRLAFSMKETAQLLGVSYLTIHRLIKRGILRSSNALRTKLISRAEIERFLATTTKGGAK
jgi:excisionase family DNA binding protein